VSIQYDTGDHAAVALDDSGKALEVHVDTGRLFYRVGNIDFANKRIDGAGSGPTIQPAIRSWRLSVACRRGRWWTGSWLRSTPTVGLICRSITLPRARSY
jgi:hypothetical protein